ncbi:MAG TPA: ABC transporter permease [Bryobacteraceae bacterium]|jgi:ABC-type Na+ efflux pump permease subunit|nr:ABC transporter permease [Bryobacteraceae bacterium]
MRFVLTSTVKDLRRIRRDPVTILTWLGIPTFIAIILVVIFGRGDARPNGKLLIVDEDQGIGATLLSGAFSQGALSNMISIEKVEREEGRHRINQGDASALLIIPKDFTIALLEGKAAQLQLLRNPAQRILPDIIEQVLSTLTDAAFYLQIVAGPQLREAARGATSDSGIAQLSVEFNHAVANSRKYLVPPMIQLETQVIEGKTDKPGGFAALMLPGMLYMAVFFIAGGLATDVWRERTFGALRRMATTPAGFGAFLAGKLIATFLVLLLVGAFGLAVAHFLADLRIANFPLAVLWIAVSGCGLYLFMMLLQSLASTERVANMLSNFVLLPLTMLGGSFFPFDLMPKGFAQIGRLTPNGWSVTELQKILDGAAVTPAAFAAVILFVVAGWLVVGWQVRRTAC